MNRNVMLSSMFAQFDKLANDFCIDTDGLDYRIENEYKGTEHATNLIRKTAKIYYHAFVIEFVYTAHGVLSVVNSILSCNVYLDKAENSVAIPLPLITDYCGMEVKTPLCIPFITNEQAMIQAFDCISDALKRLYPIAAKWCCDAEKVEQLRHKFRDELQRVFKIDSSDIELEQHVLADLFVTRFSNGAFHTALRGNYKKAAKQLGKTKRLTGYEARMQQIWLEQAHTIPEQLSAIVVNAKAYSGYGTSKVERKEFMASLIGWLALWPVFSAIYLGLYALLVWLAGRNSVYLMGPSYNYPYCVMAGFITAIAASWFTRFFFFKQLFKKDYALFCEMQGIQNLKVDNKVMKGFLTVVTIGCIALCVLLANWNLNFMQDGFVDNTKFFSFTGEYYSYNDVDYVYYKPDRINAYGETLTNPSYVIVLRDGREIDMYEYGDVSDYSEELIDFLQEKGITLR